MKLLAMIMLLAGGAAQAQQSPENARLQQELREKSANISTMITSLFMGAEKDNAETLRKKLDLIRNIRKDMGEEAQLRMQLLEELQKLQMSMRFSGESYAADENSLKMKLENLSHVESVLEKNIDRKEYAAIKERAEAGKIKGNLSSLRSVIQVYYGDNEGRFPEDLSALTNRAKYISAIPYITPPGHKKASNAVKYVSGVKSMDDMAKYVDDAGGWLYVTGNTPMSGTIVINCSHSDVGPNKAFMYTY